MAARKQREPDPPDQVRALQQALERGERARGYLLRGDERYFRDQAEALVRARGEQDGLEVCVHDTKDPDFDAARLHGDLSGGGLFAAARCVVLRNAGQLIAREGGREQPLGRALLAFLASEDVGGTVVLSADKLRADHVVAKAIAKAGGSLLNARRLYDSPPPWNPDPREIELVRWVERRASELGVKLPSGAALYVCAATGSDLYALENELAKLRSLGAEDVRKVVGWHAEGSPFTLAEHMVDGQRARALAGIEALFRGGFRERDGSRLVDSSGLVAVLLSAVTGKVRQALSGALAVARGATPDEAASQAGLPSFRGARDGFVARLQKRSPRAWRTLLHDVAELERRVKTGGTVDASDFASLALRWSRPAERASGGAGARRR